MYNNALNSSNSNEWETPEDIFNMLDQEFSFTLDPCSSELNYKVKKHYTKKENGLMQDWSKERVYVNPPYGYNTEEWVTKAFEESKKGAIVVCLIPARTDTSYWHNIIFEYAAQIRFVRGKIKFKGGKWSAPFASAIVIFDNNKKYKKIIWYEESINKLIRHGKKEK